MVLGDPTGDRPGPVMDGAKIEDENRRACRAWFDALTGQIAILRFTQGWRPGLISKGRYAACLNSPFRHL